MQQRVEAANQGAEGDSLCAHGRGVASGQLGGMYLSAQMDESTRFCLRAAALCTTCMADTTRTGSTYRVDVATRDVGGHVDDHSESHAIDKRTTAQEQAHRCFAGFVVLWLQPPRCG